MSVIGENVGGTTEHSIYSFQPTYTRMAGRHTFRGGYDFRMYQEIGAGPGRSAGQYDFGTNFTRQLDNSPTVTTGQQFAAFLLGQPTGGSIERNTDRENWSQYHGVWIQDDWRVSDKLTLNARPPLRIRRRHLREPGPQHPRLRSRRRPGHRAPPPRPPTPATRCRSCRRRPSTCAAA